jgi:hypothetical protein
MTIISKRRRSVPVEVSAERQAAWTEAEVRRIRAEAEAAREIRAAELDAARSEREASRADRQREQYFRRQRRAERAEGIRGVAQRSGRRAVLVGPIILVNALALGGQIGFARAHLGWGLPAAVVFACALESIAIYVGWHAHAALLAGDSATKLRAASYLVAGIVAGINYEHYSVHGAPSVPAVTFGLMSLLSPWLWSIHSRYEHRAQLRKAGLIDQRAAHFAAAKWLWFPFRTLGALRWSVDHGVQDPAEAWAGHAAHRSTKKAVPADAPRPAEPAADQRLDEAYADTDLSHPQPSLAEPPDPGQGAVVSLDDAVISARTAGMSVRAVSEAFNVTRYRVEKLDKQRVAATDSAMPAAVNGFAVLPDQ